MELSVILSIVIFSATFFFILTEKLHRTTVGFFGAMVMVVMGSIFDFYHPEEALHAIDFNTIGLLGGMMIIVAILEKTGFFQYVAILTAKKTKGNMWLLVLALGTVTSLLSTVLDNVTTIILIAPVTIVIARMLKLNPAPILMAEALLSDVGGVATLVGDPPNIIIGSAAGFSFNDFLVHSLPVVIVAWAATLITLRLVYNKELKQEPQNLEELSKLDPNDSFEDKATLYKILGVLALVVFLFFTHNTFHLAPSVVALIGATIALMLVSPTKDPQKILERTELSVLVFFASLFVIVGGLEATGVLEYLASFIVAGAAENLLWTAIALMWGAAIMSAIVDNIPFTVAMIPIIAYLETQGINVHILWWALVLGVGFGGNGSPIGSTANVIIMSKSEQTDNPITFAHWLKKGTPTMFVSLIVGTVAFLLFGDFWIDE